MSSGRRWRAVALLSLLAVASVAAALVLTPWALVALPFAVVGAYGAWLGLSDEELLEVLDRSTGDDLGRGPAGLS